MRRHCIIDETGNQTLIKTEVTVVDLFFQIVVFGLLAFLMFVLSAVYTKREKHRIGLAFGVLELLSAGISSSAWAWALKVSGKVDWFLFGLRRYTLFALICFAILIAGMLCVAVNLWRLGNVHLKQKKSA